MTTHSQTGSFDLSALNNLNQNLTQYFWFEEGGGGSYPWGLGAHVTLYPQSEFTNPNDSNYLKGQNILINTDGFSIRTGLLPMMTLDNDSLDFNIVDTTVGTYMTTATFTATGAQIGQSESSHSVIDANGQRFYATNGTTQLANIGYGEGVNATGGTSVAPYYTFGIRNSTTIGNYSVAEGVGAQASAYCSHAEGDNTIASGSHGSHAEGYVSEATGISAHAEGDYCRATGQDSHAEGDETVASGRRSHSSGYGTIANGDSQTAIGKHNVADTTSAFIIGNGTSNNARSNALTVDWRGRIKCGDNSGTLKSIFDIFYPVGSYYETSDANFNPAAVWGGTWKLESPSAVSARSKTATVNAAQSYYTDTIELLENTSYILLASTIGGQTADIMTLSQVEVITGTPAFIYNPVARTKSVSGQGVSTWAYIRTGSTKVTAAARCYGYYTTSHSETIRLVAYPVNRSMSAYRWHRTG